VADAVFGLEPEREAIAHAARERSLPFTGLWLDAPFGQLVNRVAERRYDASDADAAVVRKQLETRKEALEWVRIDAGGARSDVLERARAAV